MLTPMHGTRSCRDWEERLLAGRSLVPEAAAVSRPRRRRRCGCFKRLRLPDVIGTPTLGEACGEWFFPIVEALFGSHTIARPIVRHIREVFQLIPKGNGKSSNGGAVMLTALIVNRRPEAEFLFIAPTMEIAAIAYQAGEGHDPAGRSCRAKFFTFRITFGRSRIGESGATLQIKAADTDDDHRLEKRSGR